MAWNLPKARYYFSRISVLNGLVAFLFSGEIRPFGVLWARPSMPFSHVDELVWQYLNGWAISLSFLAALFVYLKDADFKFGGERLGRFFFVANLGNMAGFFSAYEFMEPRMEEGVS